MYKYLKTNRYFAAVLDNLEQVAAEELDELGAAEINTKYRGVSFTASKETLYKIVYCSKIPTRILAPIITFDCHSTKYLYKTAKSIKWDDFLPLNKTFAIFSSVSNSLITHSQYASLCLKDAIADYFRDKYGERPNVKPKTPDVWFNLYINDNKATISLELTGGSLHRRGYRKNSLEAPIMENLAAGIIRISKWNGETNLYDPFCGSGTILAEALLKVCDIPSCYNRENLGIFYMPDFNRNTFDYVRKCSLESIKPLPNNLISGSDIDKRAIQIAKENLKLIPHGDKVKLAVTDFSKIKSIENSTIITNPPYGKRLGEKNEVSRLITSFGDFLKNNCKGSKAFVYFGNRELIKKVGLKTSMKMPLKNGGLDGRLTCYEIY
ncbi:THUMP domain-containing protein [Deferribacterales bacterium Es71-Z0220]|uniref:THUMP domain-containing class I SAM-dependent RNA methyltransferase n=1 Tax=Deferrivibrio essentukiensis TaxID=2880922 RepID=UPI001F61E3F2|nr:THUMP domain-containing protein [Deferrivibrio essentukiensis]MCB4204170.1 THUMP domain-containing protein [Deferrivibrio essentukiensis]